jgi:hypothetical protein
MTKEMFMHEEVIGGRVLRTQTQVFVEIEGRHIAEIEALLLMQTGHLLVKGQRSFACGEPENGRRLLLEKPRDKPSRISARRSTCPLNDDSCNGGWR